jgi:hypothetical protein
MALHLSATGVMDVVTAVIHRRRRLNMTTFTIDADHNITAFPTPDEATPAVAAGGQPFASQKELAELAVSWPPERLVAIWNGLPGEAPVKKFKDPKTAIGRIWARVQRLGEPDRHQARQKAKDAPTKAKKHSRATPAKKANTPPKKARRKRAELRAGSKTAQAVTMLRRKGGATLAEITAKMGWQKHTVRGFMAGTMRRAGYVVESFKPEGGERTYRIK